MMANIFKRNDVIYLILAVGDFGRSGRRWVKEWHFTFKMHCYYDVIIYEMRQGGGMLAWKLHGIQCFASRSRAYPFSHKLTALVGPITTWPYSTSAVKPYQGCRHGSRGSCPTTSVPFSARRTSWALAELRDHTFSLCDLVSLYCNLNVQPAPRTKSPFISSFLGSKFAGCPGAGYVAFTC